MVRCYNRKTSNEGKYSAADLNTAMCDVLVGRTSIYKAAKLYKIPYVTLHSRVKGKRGAKKSTKGRPTSISTAEEVRLANGLKTMEKWGYGLSRKEVLEIVGNFVKTNHIETNFKDGVPGEDWFLGFKQRHRLSIKVPQNVEYARKKALDPFIIYQYFDLLKSIMDEHGLHDKPERIWNLDESSLCIDPRKTKVVGGINSPSSRTISSPGKENTTIALICSAAGQKAPPLIIYKGLHLWDQWIAPPGTDFEGTVYAATKKGWMEEAVFKNYFINTIIPSLPSERPILIIYDGHSTHMNIETLEAAMREHIIILKLPPHSSHLLQPLDLAVFKSFKVKWDEKLVAWQRQHVGQKLPKQIFSQFLCTTWKQVNSEVIINGFRKGGIVPFNRDIIPETSFPPGLLNKWKMIEHPSLSIHENGKEIIVPTEATPETQEISLQKRESTAAAVIETATPRKEKNIAVRVDETESISCSSSTSLTKKENVTFEDLLLSTVKQLPNAPTKNKKRLCPGSEVLTSQQAIDVLKEKSQQKGKTTKINKITKGKPRKRNKRESISFSSSEDEDSISPILMDSDNTDEFLDTLLETEPEVEVDANDKEEDKENLDSTGIVNVSDGCWVLVKYCPKKIIKHYVGLVSEHIDDGWIVKFTRPKGNKFVWPINADIDTVLQQDIIKVLPDPIVDRRGMYEFPVSFKNFNIQH